MAELNAITRKEKFLAKAAGQDVETPEPITREEMFLSKIAGGGLPVVELTTPFDKGAVYTAAEKALLDEALRTRLPTIIKMSVNITSMNIQINQLVSIGSPSLVANTLAQFMIPFGGYIFIIGCIVDVATGEIGEWSAAIQS